MKLRKLKQEFPCTIQTAEQGSETARSSRGTPVGETTHAKRARDKPGLTDLLLLLQQFFGATFGGIMVSILAGNVLVCVSIVLLHALFILSLPHK